jgi:cyclopropane-fatty-acyl-phospholipid synthase
MSQTTSVSALSNTTSQAGCILSSLARTLILNALKAMDRGHLILTLETGEVLHIGQPGHSISADLQIDSPAFYTRILRYGHIGFGEAYMEGEWTTRNVEHVVAWGIHNVENSPLLEGAKNKSWAINVLGCINRIGYVLRPNSLPLSRKNIQEHYDLSNDFFALFLDPSMTYSSAKFQYPGQSLEEAQQAKYASLCQKLSLEATDHVLEIGTGWGGFALYAAKTYGCRITSSTISQQQYQLATLRIREAGLSEQITVLFQDYRTLSGRFDKIASIEMIEAVGDRYYETFFAQCAALLKKDGLLGLQMITCPDARFKLLRDNVDFIQKHIFPGSLLPSIGRLNQAMSKVSDMSLFSLEDMSLSYAQTLRVWHQQFLQNLAEIRALGFEDRFLRKWEYYLLYCAAAFQMRNINAVQAVYTRPNNLRLNTVEEG